MRNAPRTPRGHRLFKTYSAPQAAHSCWLCGDSELTSVQLQSHLDDKHPRWQYIAIQKLGLHLVE